MTDKEIIERLPDVVSVEKSKSGVLTIQTKRIAYKGRQQRGDDREISQDAVGYEIIVKSGDYFVTACDDEDVYHPYVDHTDCCLGDLDEPVYQATLADDLPTAVCLILDFLHGENVL